VSARTDQEALRSSPAFLADHALARRLEGDSALSLVECAAALGKLEPHRGVAVLEVGGGRAVYGGRDSFFSEATALGLDGPVTTADLDALDEFYRSRSCRARLEVCPLADESLFSVTQRGYRILEFHTTLVLPLTEETALPEAGGPPGLDVVRLEPADFGRWTDVCARGFAAGDDDKAAAARVEFEAITRVARSHFYLALLDGKPVGAGAWGGRDGLGGLFATSVLPEARGRGVHARLIATRLAAVREAGCDLAAGVALAGSGSQRNFERAGFRPAYSKVVFVRDWEGP
jgi:GNAT superfamily N-acetyltransferase